jgi:glycosyltransferase involved in cell wall biosynthesis
MKAAAPFRPCAIVPVYDHEHAIGTVVTGLMAAGLSCLLIDDGSGPACASVLRELADAEPRVTLLTRVRNGGKGAAVGDGLRAALSAGYTHALQVDADGQHALADAPRFLAAAAAAPAALVSGRPHFDASMPTSRRIFRHLTHVLVWVHTLSFEVADSMCGFRVYPLAATVAMLDAERPGLRMDFDIEVMVRMVWRGVPVRWIDTPVSYPSDGVSHFRLLRDNARITQLHARMFLGMLWRSPRLLARRFGQRPGAARA